MNGERLKEKMKEQGLSQTALGKQCGIGQGTISEYMNEKKHPTDKNIQKIADALGCSIEYLKGNDEPMKKDDEPVTTYVSSEVYRGDIFYVKMSNRMYDTGVLDAGRPAVVVSNNQGNYHSGYVQVVYLTTKEKKPLPTHVPIICRVPSTAMCEQVQTVSKDRLIEYVRTCTEKEMKQIDEALMISLGLEDEVTCNEYDRRIEEENKKLKENLKQAQDANRVLMQEVNDLCEKYKELKSKPIHDPSEAIKYKIERDTYKQQYESLLDRLIER